MNIMISRSSFQLLPSNKYFSFPKAKTDHYYTEIGDHIVYAQEEQGKDAGTSALALFTTSICHYQDYVGNT